jgi:histidinol-phosphatase (PHP family)
MFKPLDYCYHTHTTRCGHAYGRDEEYVQAAIQAGYQVIGFSDHIFFPGVHQPGMRGDFSLLQDYIQSIQTLKKKYAKQIKIYMGFEAEYYPVFDSYYQSLFQEHKFDYLILGHHFRYQDGQFPVFYGGAKTAQILHEYADGVIQAMKTGLFSYVAHPDLFMLGYHGGWDEHAVAVTHRVAQASVQYNVPLELNLGGVQGRGLMHIQGEYRYPYPYEKFWEIASQHGVTTIIGIDAHAPEQLLQKRYTMLVDIIEKYKLRYIDRLMLK